MVQEFSANGKLLLTGEYSVLLGAKALAFPTSYGQHLKAESEITDDYIHWKSYDHLGKEWFSSTLDLQLNILHTNDEDRALFLQKIFKAACELHEKPITPAHFETRLDFPNNWGLGSSSTLLHLVSQYFNIDPLKLFFKISNGSGYDIICAGASQPILYSVQNKSAVWEEVSLPKVFEETFFIHLNQKQNSHEEVKNFINHKPKYPEKLISAISKISTAFLHAGSKGELISLMEEHETLMSDVLGRPPVKELLFRNYEGAVKSLGAWGGDFVMAIGENTKEYFTNQGYTTILPFSKLELGY